MAELKMRKWELLGQAGLVPYHGNAYWREPDPGEWDPHGATPNVPGILSVTGRWESDGEIVAVVTVEFSANPTATGFQISVASISTYEGVTAADSNRDRFRNDIYELVFFYNSVPLYITASKGVVGGRRNVLTPPPVLPDRPGKLTLVPVPGHSVFGFTFGQTSPPWTHVEFRYQLAGDFGVSGVVDAAWSEAVVSSDGAMQFTGLNANGVQYVVQAIPFNGEVSGEITLMLFTTLDNIAPIANAGPDQGVLTGAAVSLDGSASSDPNVPPDPLTYDWSQSSPASPVPALMDGTTPTPDFTAPSAGGLFEFDLIVSDGQGGSSSDEVRVAVSSAAVTVDANGCPDKAAAVKGDYILTPGGLWRKGELLSLVVRLLDYNEPGGAGIVGFARGPRWFTGGANRNFTRTSSSNSDVRVSNYLYYAMITPTRAFTRIRGHTIVIDGLAGFTGAPGARIVVDYPLRQDVVDNLACILVDYAALGPSPTLGPNAVILTNCTQTKRSGNIQQWYLDFRTWRNLNFGSTTPLSAEITTGNAAINHLSRFRDSRTLGYRIGYILVDRRQRCPDNLHDNPWHKVDFVDTDARTTLIVQPPQPDGRAVNVTGSGFRIQWDRVTLIENGVDVVTGYLVTIINLTDDRTDTEVIDNPATLFLDVTNKQPGHRFRFYIQSRRGASPNFVYSSDFFKHLVTTGAVAPPPTTPTGAPGTPLLSIVGGAESDTAILGNVTATLTASEEGSATTGFTLEHRVKATPENTWNVITLSGNSASRVIANQTRGDTVQARAKAFDADGDDSGYTAVMETDVPLIGALLPPTNFAMAFLSGNNRNLWVVDASWAKPNISATIEGYRLSHGDLFGFGAFLPVNLDGADTLSHRITSTQRVFRGGLQGRILTRGSAGSVSASASVTLREQFQDTFNGIVAFDIYNPTIAATIILTINRSSETVAAQLAKYSGWGYRYRPALSNGAWTEVTGLPLTVDNTVVQDRRIYRLERRTAGFNAFTAYEFQFKLVNADGTADQWVFWKTLYSSSREVTAGEFKLIYVGMGDYQGGDSTYPFWVIHSATDEDDIDLDDDGGFATAAGGNADTSWAVGSNITSVNRAWRTGQGFVLPGHIRDTEDDDDEGTEKLWICKRFHLPQGSDSTVVNGVQTLDSDKWQAVPVGGFAEAWTLNSPYRWVSSSIINDGAGNDATHLVGRFRNDELDDPPWHYYSIPLLHDPNIRF